MNRDELLVLHKKTCDECREIIKVKNDDYSGGYDSPFDNFKISETLDVPAEIGLLMRVMDKISRIKSFVRDGKLSVKDESVNDAIGDIINYMILLKGIILEKKEINNDNGLFVDAMLKSNPIKNTSHSPIYCNDELIKPGL